MRWSCAYWCSFLPLPQFDSSIWGAFRFINSWMTWNDLDDNTLLGLDYGALIITRGTETEWDFVPEVFTVAYRACLLMIHGYGMFRDGWNDLERLIVLFWGVCRKHSRGGTLGRSRDLNWIRIALWQFHCKKRIEKIEDSQHKDRVSSSNLNYCIQLRHFDTFWISVICTESSGKSFKAHGCSKVRCRGSPGSLTVPS